MDWNYFSKKAFTISLIVCAIISAVIWYLTLPALSFESAGLWSYIIFCGLGSIVASLFIGGVSEEELSASGIGALVLIGALVIFAIFGIASTKLFHVKDYRAAAEVITGENAADVLPDTDTMPIIDRNTARKLGDRTMGAMEKYLSQYEVSSEYNLIVYNGEDYYVSPLLYGGFFKYNNSKAVGIPAYVLVNARTGEALLVELEAGKEIKYAPSAYWGYDLTRHLRMEYPSKLFAGENFEVDDNGHPHYIIPTLKSTAGLFGSRVIESVIVMDAHSGECKEYALNEVPDWVDNVYEVDRLMKQVAWNYDLVHGCFNFSNKEVRKTSYSFDQSQYYCFIKDGHTWVYTGVTSAGADESNIGFLAMSLRTGEYIYFSDPGAEESSAQESAKGLVQQYNYSAGPVILVNVDGHQTYFCALKDAQGLVKMYAFVNKTDYTKVAVESSIEKAAESYRKMMTGINTDDPIETPEAYTAEGIVSEVYEVTVDGNTMFIFYLEGKDELYVSTIGNTFEQPRKLIPSAKVALIYNVVDNTNVVSEITFK